MRLSKRELDIMNVFWEKNAPLIASEIAAGGEGFSISTVQTALKNLQKAGYIKQSDIVYSGNVLTRQYTAVKEPSDYLQDEINALTPKSRKKIQSSMPFTLYSALLNGEIPDEKVLDDLEKIIAEKRAELRRGK